MSQQRRSQPRVGAFKEKHNISSWIINESTNLPRCVFPQIELNLFRLTGYYMRRLFARCSLFGEFSNSSEHAFTLTSNSICLNENWRVPFVHRMKRNGLVRMWDMSFTAIDGYNTNSIRLFSVVLCSSFSYSKWTTITIDLKLNFYTEYDRFGCTKCRPTQVELSSFIHIHVAVLLFIIRRFTMARVQIIINNEWLNWILIACGQWCTVHWFWFEIAAHAIC